VKDDHVAASCGVQVQSRPVPKRARGCEENNQCDSHWSNDDEEAGEV